MPKKTNKELIVTAMAGLVELTIDDKELIVDALRTHLHANKQEILAFAKQHIFIPGPNGMAQPFMGNWEAFTALDTPATAQQAKLELAVIALVKKLG